MDYDLLTRIAVCNIILGISRKSGGEEPELVARGLIELVNTGGYVLTLKGADTLLDDKIRSESPVSNNMLRFYKKQYHAMIEKLESK